MALFESLNSISSSSCNRIRNLTNLKIKQICKMLVHLLIEVKQSCKFLINHKVCLFKIMQLKSNQKMIPNYKISSENQLAMENNTPLEHLSAKNGSMTKTTLKENMTVLPFNNLVPLK